MTVCGAKTRQGTACQRPAGWGTQHVGQGRCKLHGGNAGRPVEHGRYSVTRRRSLQEKIAVFYNDPATGDLRSELALLRALLQDYLDRWVDADDSVIAGRSIGHVFEMVDAIGKMVERIAKILATTALTQAELQLLQVTLIDAITEFIPEPERQRAFISRIAGTLGASPRTGLGTLSTVRDNEITA
jgi:hypothetical protein